MPSNRANCDRGFTLLEVLAAIVIVALAMGALFPAAASAARNYAALRLRQAALNEAWNEVQRFRSGQGGGEAFRPAPRALELRRMTVEKEQIGLRWEVLHGR